MSNNYSETALDVLEDLDIESFRPALGEWTGFTATAYYHGKHLRLAAYHTSNLDGYDIDVWTGDHWAPVVGEYVPATTDVTAPAWVLDSDVASEVLALLDQVADEMRGRIRTYVDERFPDVLADVLEQAGVPA